MASKILAFAKNKIIIIALLFFGLTNLSFAITAKIKASDNKVYQVEFDTNNAEVFNIRQNDSAIVPSEEIAAELFSHKKILVTALQNKFINKHKKEIQDSKEILAAIKTKNAIETMLGVGTQSAISLLAIGLGSALSSTGIGVPIIAYGVVEAGDAVMTTTEAFRDSGNIRNMRAVSRGIVYISDAFLESTNTNKDKIIESINTKNVIDHESIRNIQETYKLSEAYGKLFLDFYKKYAKDSMEKDPFTTNLIPGGSIIDSLSNSEDREELAETIKNLGGEIAKKAIDEVSTELENIYGKEGVNKNLSILKENDFFKKQELLVQKESAPKDPAPKDPKIIIDWGDYNNPISNSDKYANDNSNKQLCGNNCYFYDGPYDNKKQQTIAQLPPTYQFSPRAPLFVSKFRQTPIYTFPNTHKTDEIALIKAIYGDNYVIADWNDLSAPYNANPAEFARQWKFGYGMDDGIRATPFERHHTGNANNARGSLGISVNGVYTGSDILNYFDKKSPGYDYAVLASLGENDFVLGGGTPYNNGLLVKKIDTNISDFKFDISKGPTTKKLWYGNLVYWDDANVNQKNLKLEIDPVQKKISTLQIDGTDRNLPNFSLSTHYKSHNSYYFGKDYMGVRYGYQDNNLHGWVVTTPDRDLATYDYTSWGEWQENLSKNTNNVTKSGAHWIAGRLTPANEIPTNSVANYNGKVLGLVDNGSVQSVKGVANLTANFSDRTLNGSFNNMKTANGNAWKTLSVNAGWSAGVNSISGSLSGDGASGSVKGNFFGSNAKELGGSWQTTAGSEKAAGIFHAKQ